MTKIAKVTKVTKMTKVTKVTKVLKVTIVTKVDTWTVLGDSSGKNMLPEKSSAEE